MNNSEFNPIEQRLILRLQRAPQPTLADDAFQAIQARMLEAVDTMPAPRTFQKLPSSWLFGGVLVVIAIVVMVVLASGNALTPIAPSATATSTPTLTPTLTPTDTPTQIIPSATMTQSHTPTMVLSATMTQSYTTTLVLSPTVATSIPSVTVAPSATVSPTLTLTATVTASATPQPETVLVVEGKIESISDDSLTIYGIEFLVDATEPLLANLQVGDTLRLEGRFDEQIRQFKVVQVEALTAELVIDSQSGLVWRDTGTCDNPPPSWAPANGWRKRCEQALPIPANSSSNSGSGNDDRDDSDDDQGKENDSDDD